jgi:hypothetical protein
VGAGAPAGQSAFQKGYTSQVTAFLQEAMEACCTK